MGFFSRKKTPPPTPAVTESKSVRAIHDPLRSRESEARLPQQSGRVQQTHVLIQPLVTEKATATGTYLFKVSPTASKSEIRKEFKAKYGKDPRKVNVLNVMGKVKMRGRVVGKRSNWKKAMIYLAQGENVDLFQ